MGSRICYICGQPATGFASIWTAKDGERWYCHGDDDSEPTCYEDATLATSTGDADRSARVNAFFDSLPEFEGSLEDAIAKHEADTHAAAVRKGMVNE